MAGGGQLGGGVLATGDGHGGRAGFGCAHGGLPDEACPLRQVAFIQHAGHRHADKVHVRHILVAIGEGEPCRLAVEVDGFRAGAEPAIGAPHRFEGRHVAALQHAEDLAEGQGAGGGGREAAHLALAIVKAEAIAQLGAVTGQVGRRQHPGIDRVGSNLGDHGLGQGAAVEGVGALVGQGTQHPGQGRVGESGSCRLGGAIGLVEIGAGIRVPGEIGILGQQGGQAWAYHKPLLSQGDGGREQAGPGQFAIALVRQGQGAYRAGDPHGAPAHHAVVEGHRLAISHEQLIRGGGGGRFPTIHGGNPFAIPYQHEGAAADAGGLRLHQGQHQLHRDGGIHRRAARLDHLIAGIHRQRVGGGHHEGTALPALLVGPATGGLGGDQGLGGRSIMEGILRGAAGEQAEGDQQAEGFEGHDTLLVCFLYGDNECGTVET